MPQREGKCTNFGLCTMADSREPITLPEGEDFSCPECGKMLAEVEGKGKGGGGGAGSKGSGKSKLALAALAVALLGGGGYYLLMQPDEDTKKEEPKPPAPKPPDPKPIDVQPPAPAPAPLPSDVTPPPTAPAPDPHAQELEELKRQQKKILEEQAQLKKEQDRLAKLRHDSEVPPPEPKPKPVIDTKPETTAYSGPSSGTMVWEGTVHSKGELVTIDGGVASKGSLVSGKLPGVAVLIQSDNPKKVAIASPPGPDNKFQRIVLRVQGSGPQKVVLSWSLP